MDSRHININFSTLLTGRKNIPNTIFWKKEASKTRNTQHGTQGKHNRYRKWTFSDDFKSRKTSTGKDYSKGLKLHLKWKKLRRYILTTKYVHKNKSKDRSRQHLATFHFTSHTKSLRKSIRWNLIRNHLGTSQHDPWKFHENQINGIRQ